MADRRRPSLLGVAFAFAAWIWARECRAEEPSARWFWGADTMVRNADLWSVSGMGAVRLLGVYPRPSLGLTARLRAGLGGGTVSAGVLAYYVCPHVDLPCLALGAQAVALETWLSSTWTPGTYVGGELRIQVAFIDVTVGLLEPTDFPGPFRLQAGVGVGL